MVRTLSRGIRIAALALVLASNIAYGRAQHAPAPAPAPAPATDTATDTATNTAATPDPAIAASDESEARRRYAQGGEFYRRGRYSEAVAEFTEAYSRWPNPTILFALGQAFEGLSEVNRAIATYRQYLDTAPADDVRRTDVLAKIAELEGLLATLRIDSNVGASVYVDGERIGDAPGEFSVGPGRHAIELRAEGFESHSETVTMAGGTERALTFELQAIAVTAQLVREPREPFRFPRPVFYTAVGLTGAGLVTWAGMATTTLVRANEYNDRVGSTSFERADAREVARRSNVALGVTGGVAAATALVGGLTQWHPRRHSTDDEAQGEVMAFVAPVRGGALVTARWTR